MKIATKTFVKDTVYKVFFEIFSNLKQIFQLQEHCFGKNSGPIWSGLLSKIFPKNCHIIRKIGNLKNQNQKREFLNSTFSNYMSNLEQNVT